MQSIQLSLLSVKVFFKQHADEHPENVCSAYFSMWMSSFWHSLRRSPTGFSKTVNNLFEIILGLKRTDEVRTYQKKKLFSQYLSVLYTNCLNNFAKFFAESIIVYWLTILYEPLKLKEADMIREDPTH